MAACSGERELHFFHHRNSSETFQQLVTSKKQMGNRTSLNLCPRESHSVVHFHSLLLVLMVRSSANDDLMNGMICKYTVVLEVKEIILKADIGNQARSQLATISRNATITRSAGTKEASIKLVVRVTAVAMKQWQIAICRWIVWRSKIGMPLHANCRAHGLQIHQIIGKVPQLLLNYYILISFTLSMRSSTLPKAPPL